jgi:hypothetical protein
MDKKMGMKEMQKKGGKEIKISNVIISQSW